MQLFPFSSNHSAGLPSGKTVWSTVITTWSGQRRLAENGEEVSVTDAEHEAEMVARRLYSTVPNWCSFYGVTCTSVSITSIDVSGLGLVGSLPSSIGDIHSLQTFDVSSNSLTGTIPTTIGNWYNAITTIKMKANQFTGSIPSTIGFLYGLTDLDLSINYLFGTIPSSISRLSSLTILKLQQNFLTMGTLTTLPQNYLNSVTINSQLDLSQNCLAYSSTTYSFSALHCRPSSQPTSRKWNIFLDSMIKCLCRITNPSLYTYQVRFHLISILICRSKYLFILFC